MCTHNIWLGNQILKAHVRSMKGRIDHKVAKITWPATDYITRGKVALDHASHATFPQVLQRYTVPVFNKCLDKI